MIFRDNLEIRLIVKIEYKYWIMHKLRSFKALYFPYQ